MYDTLPQAYAAVCKERDELACKYRKALDDLVKQSHETKSEWISVKDRLPKNNNTVLVSVHDTTICDTTQFMIGSCDNGFWFLGVHLDCLSYPHNEYRVTHWMPLPEPPEEEKNRGTC